MARRDDKRCAEVSERCFDFVAPNTQCVQSQLKKVRWVSHSDSPLQIGPRANYTNKLRTRPHREGERRPGSMRSRYLAIRSNSRLTRSLGRAAPRFVCVCVCETIQVTKVFDDNS